MITSGTFYNNREASKPRAEGERRRRGQRHNQERLRAGLGHSEAERHWRADMTSLERGLVLTCLFNKSQKFVCPTHESMANNIHLLVIITVIM